MQLTFSPMADQDLEAIGDYISKGNQLAALDFLERLLQRCMRITYAPASGTPRDDLASGLRSVPFGNYVIYYEASHEAVRVQRILHSARDVARQFRRDPPE